MSGRTRRVTQPGPAQALPVPRTAEGRSGLAALLRAPGEALVALDFDGTLSEIVDDPAAARGYPPAVAALRRLAPLAGTVAVITGRPALAALELGALDQVPGLIVLGQYGLQRWQSGRLTSPPVPPGVAEARRDLPGVLAAAGAPEGTRTEDKGEALAVHTRRAADPVAALDRLRAPLAELAARTGLTVEPGRLVIELRPPGTDKGTTLKNLVTQRSSRAILYVGDDLGDLQAFLAVRELRASGVAGLAVCSGSAEVSGLAEETDLVVDGPAGVAALLDGIAAAWGG
jgi:trehalose 6-phosphate phosphatase